MTSAEVFSVLPMPLTRIDRAGRFTVRPGHTRNVDGATLARWKDSPPPGLRLIEPVPGFYVLRAA